MLFGNPHRVRKRRNGGSRRRVAGHSLIKDLLLLSHPRAFVFGVRDPLTSIKDLLLLYGKVNRTVLARNVYGLRP
jgi:hypothetical protein